MMKLIILLTALLALPASAEPLLVAAAADLSYCMDELGRPADDQPRAGARGRSSCTTRRRS